MLLECVWLGPSVPAQMAGSTDRGREGSRQPGNPESPAPGCARERNVLLWVLKQTQPRKGVLLGAGRVGGAPATRLPLFPRRLSPLRWGQGWAGPSCSLCGSEALGARGGKAEQGKVTVGRAMFSQSFSYEAAVRTSAQFTSAQFTSWPRGLPAV